MSARATYQAETAAAFLVRARAYLAAGDVAQASGAGWDAAARMVEAVAEERWWARTAPGHLHQTVGRVVDELGDRKVWRLFHSASALQQNFYEGLMPAESVAAGLNAVEEFVRRLGDLID